MGFFVLFFAVFCKLFPINSLLSFQRIYIDESLSLLSLLVNVCSFHFERLLRSTFSLGACGFFLMFTKAKVITPSNIVIIFLKDKVNYWKVAFHFFFVFEHIFWQRFVVYGDLDSRPVNCDKLCNSGKLYHSVFIYFYWYTLF